MYFLEEEEKTRYYTSSKEISLDHRVDRVLGFFSSWPNWDPHPLTRRLVYPPLLFLGGGHTRLQVRGWGEPIWTTGEKAWHSVYSEIRLLRRMQ
jgi:hypothetical protein